MISDDCQRFTERRESRRPAGELIRRAEYDVDPISPGAAKSFVVHHHYAGTCGPTAHPFGLFRFGVLVGVACFGPAASSAAHAAVFPTLDARRGTTLSRFVLLDEVPGNGESYFLARCLDVLRARGVVGVETCADPIRGHVGTIYQATNAHHVGRTGRRTVRVFADGEVFSARAASKVRTGDRGRAYAVSQLVRRGAPRPDEGDDLGRWLAEWLPQLTTTQRHPGCFRYLWCLDRRRRREVLRAPALPYPKFEVRS